MIHRLLFTLSTRVACIAESHHVRCPPIPRNGSSGHVCLQDSVTNRLVGKLRPSSFSLVLRLMKEAFHWSSCFCNIQSVCSNLRYLSTHPTTQTAMKFHPLPQLTTLQVPVWVSQFSIHHITNNLLVSVRHYGWCSVIMVLTMAVS